MVKRYTPVSKTRLFIQGFLIYAWATVLSVLSVTDTWYSVYLLCALMGALCLYDNQMVPWLYTFRQKWMTGIFAGVFSCAVALANYTLFSPLAVLQNLFDLTCVLAGGWVIGYHILLCLLRRLPLESDAGGRHHPGWVFLGVFFAVAAIDLAYLLLALYPGVLTTDSFSTLRQFMGQQAYNNVMPFWHTVTVEVFVKLGLKLFGDINAAIALFHGAQILFMAACFGYTVMTMYQMGVPKLLLAAVFGIYGLLPYNIVYSVTMWKDIPFGGAALLMVTALYRVLKGLGRRHWLDWLLLTAGAVGFSLWRTNGWYAFFALTVLMFLLLRKRHKGLLILMAVVLVLCWLLIGPVLDAWGVEETNFVEAFGIPMQQIARVLHNGRELAEEDMEMLSQIFFVERTAEVYDPLTVDPVKFQTFYYDQVPYLMEHLGEYVKLYLRIGLQYPTDYWQAWVEQTKGYWHGGYHFWTYTLKMGGTEFGVAQTPGDNLVAKLFAAWFRYVEKPAIFQCFTSIGLHVWALVSCAVLCGMRKREEGLLTVPVLVLIAGLWLGTPVFAEFRYAYPMILSMPMILAATVFEPRE
ncbi:MAG: hypothetical protein J6J12_05695 [Oscillospiraceae bacterium]|nr:hypothetical protein [Oscillospiraceae bacterium]